ncbi:MAG: phage tail protein [Chloroflexaceae bacterium]|nr:phage tail protein [Chloroflexaceae bacterium]
MANATDELVLTPFASFNFGIEITLPSSAEPLCSAAFAECDGLELTMDVKTIREGGNNTRQIRLCGPVSYGAVTLKRGMTRNFDLWRWVRTQQREPRTRATATVVIYSADRSAVNAEFVLSRCLPIKLKAPPLNAREGVVAIEELQIAYEHLELKGLPDA